jgi:hypothetical protein
MKALRPADEFSAILDLKRIVGYQRNPYVRRAENRHRWPRRLSYPLFLLGLTYSPICYAQAYPGCTEPSSGGGQTFVVDPIRGSDRGDGSAEHPWASLQSVVSSIGGAPPRLSTVPYHHRSVDGQWETSPDPDAPVKPGDRIYLMNGEYGDVRIGVYGQEISNSKFVTIEGAPGQTPELRSLQVLGARKFLFEGLKIQGRADHYAPLVRFAGQSELNPDQDIVLRDSSISSDDDVSSWSQLDWQTDARWVGIQIDGLSNTVCSAITNTRIFNVRIGVSLGGDKTLFANNQIDNFGDDALDYMASDLVIARNTVTNGHDIGDQNHNDAMQGQIGKGAAYRNILIEGNFIEWKTRPDLSFPTVLQGIDAFDSNWYDVKVLNNVVITNSWHGISFSSVHAGLIANNTVVGTNSPTFNPVTQTFQVMQPRLVVGSRTHQGSPSNDVIVRNNIAPQYDIVSDPTILADHNLIVNADETIRSRLASRSNAVPIFAPSAVFQTFDLENLRFDLRLRPGSPAIGAGIAASAPGTDFLGKVRREPIDIGAYAFMGESK